MPYFIEQDNEECQSGWAVTGDTGVVHGCHTTKESAIQQAVAISISTDEPFQGERAAVGLLEIGDFVSWDVLDPEILAVIIAVEGEMAVIQLYDEEDGVFEPSDKLLVINVFKIDKVPRPELTTQKLEDTPDAEPMPEDEMRAPAPKEDQITGSDKNKPGSAKGAGGSIEISEQTRTALQNKVTDHNKAMTDADKPSWTKVTLGQLAAVYRRGAGAFSVSHRPGMTRNQWALARVNAYLYLMRNGRPENPKYITDYDLLPSAHPKSTRDVGAVDEVRALNQSAPAYMRAAARRGLAYYADGLAGDGLVDRTVREAREMVEGRVSDDKWIRIAAWIARHLGDLDSPDANPSSDNYPSAGVVAHLLWGSGPSKSSAQRTLDYAESVVGRIRAEQESERMTELVMDEARAKWLKAAYTIKAKIEGNGEARALGKTEVRTNHIEMRATGDGRTFEGYASVFDQASEPLPFTEYVRPGAFKRSLQSRNRMMLLWNHDSSNPLASTRNGSLQLTEDNVGLKVTATLPDTTLGRDISELVRTGVVDSMSFGFSVKRDSWSKDGQTRYLEDVTLYEVSLVSTPAYEGTAGTLSVRSGDTISADALADALLRIESGEELNPEQGALVAEVIGKLVKTPEVEEVQGDILALKKKKLDLLLKEAI